MATGTVKWFNLTKGFGFISPDAGGPDVFVHISAVEQAGLQGLADGQRINYELRSERGKFSATNLGPELQKQPSVSSRTNAFAISTRISSDLPSDIDELGLRPLVNGFDAILNDEHTRLPVTIAITGGWGAGKSSLMRQVQASLRRPRERSHRSWHTVWFPAWKYENSDKLWVALAKAIYDQPRSQMSRIRRVWFRIQLEKARLGWLNFLRLALVPAASAALALMVLAPVTLVPAQGRLNGLSPFWGGVFATAATLLASAGHYWGVASNPFKRALERHASKANADGSSGFTEKANKDVDQLIKLLTKKGAAVAVFVDDLDRCGARHVVEIVETISQVFNDQVQRECVFFLAMDRDFVASAVEATYRDIIGGLRRSPKRHGERFGLQFISKVVQMSVALPAPTEHSMERFLSSVTGNLRPVREGAGEVDGSDNTASRTAQLENLDELVENFRKEILDRRPTNPNDVSNVVQSILSERGKEMTPIQKRALSAAERRERSRLFNADSEDVAWAEFEVMRHIEKNPRMVKRFDNLFRLQLQVANESSGDNLDFGPDQLLALAKWVVLRMRWPDLADAIDLEQDLLHVLETQASADDAGVVANQSAGTSSVRKWLGNKEIRALLHEQKVARRVSTLPLDSFLSVA